MKIGIITIHFGVNYGSALQAYALSKYLKNNNNEVTLINYIPERYNFHNRNKKIIQNNGFIKGLIKLICSFPSRLIYDRIFNNFLKKNTPLSKKITDEESLKKLFGDYDVLITGSDQIWNSDYNDGFNSVYFLSFANYNSVKIAYAASCGKTAFSNEEIYQMKELISKMDGVSVRESSMITLLADVGITNTVHVLDPVMLVGKEEWEFLIKSTNRIIDEPYLVMYLLDEDTNETVDFACKLAHKMNLKTVFISFGHLWSGDKRVDYYLIRNNPVDFVNLIYNANFVVTNSFHGMAFSITLNKQFIAFKRKAYNSRLDSLAKLFDIQKNLINSSEINDININTLQSINYEKVNEILDEMQQKSKDFLKKANI